jgi:hypothetical protein
MIRKPAFFNYTVPVTLFAFPKDTTFFDDAVMFFFFRFAFIAEADVDRFVLSNLTDMVTWFLNIKSSSGLVGTEVRLDSTCIVYKHFHVPNRHRAGFFPALPASTYMRIESALWMDWYVAHFVLLRDAGFIVTTFAALFIFSA